MQQELHGTVVKLLQAAGSERELSRRLQLLEKAWDVLLHADTPTEIVAASLDHFLGLQSDPHTSLRRYVAHFLGRVSFCKPSLALRCLPGVVALLADADSIVKELAAKAAASLHGRALYLISVETETTSFQRSVEHLLRIQEAMVQVLESGSPEHPVLFQLAAQWAKAFVLTQTSSPLLMAIRVPAELRGVACLQDFPEKVTHFLDLGALAQQAEGLFALLCRVLEGSLRLKWKRWQLRVLLQCTGAVMRQRPLLLEEGLACWSRLLGSAVAVEGREAPSAGEASRSRAATELRVLLHAECQQLLASNIVAEKRACVAELLGAVGQAGVLEDLLAQAKYRQISAAVGRGAPTGGEPLAKRLRRESKQVWSNSMPGFDSGAADVDAFDGDALYCGEAEAACRKFEDYFGLPSQREPAGHVPGPALLASRAASRADLARIALTSLNSLALKRSLLRDRAHEKVVSFSEALEAGSAKNGKSKEGDASKDFALFLTAEPTKPQDCDDDLDAALLASRVALSRQAEAPAAEEGRLLPAEGLASELPGDAPAREQLQLQLYDELLASHRRMAKSSFRTSLSARQLDAFNAVSCQVALHVAAGAKSGVQPSMQRAMCKAFMVDTFEALKGALTSVASDKGAGGPAAAAAAEAKAKAALGKLVELFHAKFATDIAKWQDAAGRVMHEARFAAAKTPVQEILEGKKGAERKREAFTYTELFEMFVAEFEALLIPKRELRTFLNEIPFVPMSAFKMLEAQCLVAGTRKMALLTVLSLVESKPSCRWHCLRLLFRLAYSGGDDSSIRFDTIRLIINKIYSAGADALARWQLPHLDDTEAGKLLGPAGAERSNWEIPDDEFLPLQQLKGRCVEDVATTMLRSMAPASAKFAFSLKVPGRVEELRGDLFKSVVCNPKDRVWLYLALCIKRPVLLHELVETFVMCDEDMREHLINSIEEALKYIPSSEPELLVLVEKAIPETERLIIKVLHILVQTSRGKETMSKGYGAAVTRLYSVTQNPRLLVPVFDLLERSSLLDFLPAVMQLEVDEVAAAFQQLIRSKDPPLTISELLTELHHMNKPTENIVPVKYSMQALNVIFSMREQFDPKVYGIVVQALVEESGPLPTLFMRTVIQVVQEVPRLCDFIVIQILPRLVRQEVWSDDNMWRGFMLVLQHTFASQSGGAARVLAMLPMSQLEDVLVQHPDWKAQLREFVARQPVGAVAPHVRQLLQ